MRIFGAERPLQAVWAVRWTLGIELRDECRLGIFRCESNTAAF